MSSSHPVHLISGYICKDTCICSHLGLTLSVQKGNFLVFLCWSSFSSLDGLHTQIVDPVSSVGGVLQVIDRLLNVFYFLKLTKHSCLPTEERVVPIEVCHSKLSKYLQGVVFRCDKCTFTCSSDESLQQHIEKHN